MKTEEEENRTKSNTMCDYNLSKQDSVIQNVYIEHVVMHKKPE